jgi:shikimate kinase
LEEGTAIAALRDAMGVRAVFLVGFMASGKSSVGRELARRLEWDFVDLDAEIEARERQTIAEIFLNRGEPEFRLIEAAVLHDLTDSLDRDTVIALGGGAFAHPENLDLLKNHELLKRWPSVFLDAPVDELWQRCLEDTTNRPLRKNRDEFARLYEARLPFYRQATVTVVTSGKDPASLCTEIERTLQFRGENGAAGSSQAPSTHFGTGESQ